MTINEGVRCECVAPHIPNISTMWGLSQLYMIALSMGKESPVWLSWSLGGPIDCEIIADRSQNPIHSTPQHCHYSDWAILLSYNDVL